MKLDFTRPPDTAQLAAAERDRSGVRDLQTNSAGIRRRFKTSGAAVAGLLALAACAPYVTNASGERMKANSQEFRDYARQVFEMHNDAVTRIAYALDDLESEPDQGDRYSSIMDADDRMMDACAELNHVAVARRDDKQVSLRGMARVAASVPDCERATVEAARLIADSRPNPEAAPP